MQKRRPGANEVPEPTGFTPPDLGVDDEATTDNEVEMQFTESENTEPQAVAAPEAANVAPSMEEVKERIRQMAQGTDNVEQVMPPALHDSLLSERNDVMHVINELEDQLDRQQEVREALERELTTSNDKLQGANQRCQELEWHTVTLQTRVEALEQVRQEVTLLEEEVANANGRLQRVMEEYKGLEKDRNRIRNELKESNKQLEELWAVRKERDGLRTDVRDLSSRIEETERATREADEERTQLQTRYHEALSSLDEARAERHQQQLALRAAEDRARELARVQDELVDKLEVLRGDKKALQAQLAHQERDNARMVEQRQFYETELASLRNSNRNAETALASVKKAFAEVRVALTETKSRARRRMIESWPRVGGALNGTGDSEAADDEAPFRTTPPPIEVRHVPSVPATDRETALADDS